MELQDTGPCDRRAQYVACKAHQPSSLWFLLLPHLSVGSNTPLSDGKSWIAFLKILVLWSQPPSSLGWDYFQMRFLKILNIKESVRVVFNPLWVNPHRDWLECINTYSRIRVEIWVEMSGQAKGLVCCLFPVDFLPNLPREWKWPPCVPFSRGHCCHP